jgi:hypothetical protein
MELRQQQAEAAQQKKERRRIEEEEEKQVSTRAGVAVVGYQQAATRPHCASGIIAVGSNIAPWYNSAVKQRRRLSI